MPAISAPLKQLEKLIVDSFSDIEAWFRAQAASTPSPFYSSVDLRTTPGDSTIFPPPITRWRRKRCGGK